MLRFITQKLRNQSLNEVRPIDDQACAWVSEQFCDEGAHLQRGDPVKDRPTVNDRINGSSCNNNLPCLTNEATSSEPQLKELSPEQFTENLSSQLCLPRTDSFPEVNHKETDEENVPDEAKENHPFYFPVLELSNKEPHYWSPLPSKRKAGDVKRRKAESGSDSSSSDDEIKELCSYGITKFRASSRPPDKMAAISSSFVVCQRRRIRTPSTNFHTFSRPSINFDKMQQTLMLKRQRNRVVRVRTLPSLQSASRHCDPAAIGFKPITNLNPCINHLAPVEDPLAF